MLTLAAWFHTLNPIVVQLGPFALRWYGLAYLAGFIVAYAAMRALAKRGLILIPAERVGDAMLWLIGGTLVGGRIGYALVYDRSLFFSFRDHIPWWGLFAIHEGGMASHGGMVGLALAAWKVSRGFKDEKGRVIGRSPWLHTMDAVALVCPAGVFFGRLANFINGELLGEIVAKPGVAGPWWSVQFPQELDLPAKERPQTPERWEQIQALAAKIAPRDVDLGLHKLSHEGWNYVEQLRPLVSSRHPSQIYQAVAEGLVVGLVLWVVWARPRKPGVVAAWFLMTYGVLRIATELIRLPDAQLAVQRIYGLSRGQWLSAAMIVIGAWLLWFAVRRPAEKMGGWLSTRATQAQ